MKIEQKKLFAVPLLFSVLLSVVSCTNIPSHKESSHSSIVVTYSYSADAFYLMDQVSEAIPSFFLVEDYRKTWEDRYGISEKDVQYFQKYKKIREKYRNIPKPIPVEYPKNLFASTFADPIATAFYQSEKLNEAFSALDISKEDLIFIKEFYKFFHNKINKIIGNLSIKSRKQIQKSNDFLHQHFVLQYLEDIRSFYNSVECNYTARIVWRPGENGLSARFYNGYILLQLSPEMLPMLDSDSKKFTELFWAYMGVIIHEATHGFSSAQQEKEKLHLTSSFLEGSGPLEDVFGIGYEKYTFLEEPLVQVVSQALFFKKYFPKIFDLENPAGYSHPLVQRYLPLVEPYFNKNHGIDNKLAYKLVLACKEYMKKGEF